MTATVTRSRLTDQQRADRQLTGGDLQAQITDLAEILGWSWCHWRAAKTNRGWRVPVEGPLGKGWPDLFMVHPVRRRAIAIEVKRQLSDPLTADQEWVHRILRVAGIDVHVFRPSDMTEGWVQAVLS